MLNNRRKQQKGERLDILFGKLGNIKGAFPKIGPIKDEDGRDLVDAEEIKKGWKEHMEELC